LIPGVYEGVIECSYYVKNSISGEELFLGEESLTGVPITVNRNGFPVNMYGGKEPRAGATYSPFIGDVDLVKHEATIIGVSDSLLGYTYGPRNLYVVSSIRDSLSYEDWPWRFEGYILGAYINAPYDDFGSGIRKDDLIFLNYFEARGEEFDYEGRGFYDSIAIECEGLLSPN